MVNVETKEYEEKVVVGESIGGNEIVEGSDTVDNNDANLKRKKTDTDVGQSKWSKIMMDQGVEKYGQCVRCNTTEFLEIYLRACPWCKRICCCHCTTYCHCGIALLCDECDKKNDGCCGTDKCAYLAAGGVRIPSSDDESDDSGG
jgi:hypothetical protein